MTDAATYWRDLGKSLADCEGYEERLDRLRVFTRERRRLIQEKDLEGAIDLPSLFLELTSLAEAVLRGSLDVTWKEILSRTTVAPPRGDFAIVAMGKLGGAEITYRSDLDIIYIYEDPDDQEFYTRLGTRIISALSVLTRQGIAYEVDTALRPSGNRGTLVSSWDSFQEYHRTMGRTWERQSLIKARPLFGRPDAVSGFSASLKGGIEEIAYQEYDPAEISREIRHLRQRMEREIAREKPGHYNLKTGCGGLVDVEFAVQYLQLAHGRERPNLRNPNTISALKALKREGILEGGLADRLEEAYLFLRLVETRMRLYLDRPADELVEGAEWVRPLEKRFFAGERIVPRLVETRRAVRGAYERILS